MPVIGVPLGALRERLGVELDGTRLLRILEEIGCDVDGFARLKRTRCERCGYIEERTETEGPPVRCDRCDADHRGDPGGIADLPDLEVVRMELLAVRPDMFDPGGLARALRGYLDVETGLPRYEAAEGPVRVRVDPSLRDPSSLRPFIACAVLEEVSLDPDRIKLLMKLQENLHWALGRNRKLASIGVYDLDPIDPEIEYTTEDPDLFKFVPLGGRPEAQETLRSILMNHSKGKAYRHLLEGFARYPILRDRSGRVLSMPPIINSEETKVHAGSRSLFIDVTGMGERIVSRTLNILTTSLLENLPGARLRSVRIEGATSCDGSGVRAEAIRTPDLAPQVARIGVEATRRLLGIDVDAGAIRACLEKMRHGITGMEGDRIEVEVAPYRNDVLHERDLMEDVAIAYGYHRVTPSLLPARTIGRPRPLEELTGRAREVLGGLGFLEVTTLVLLGDETHDAALGLEADARAVQIDNPISSEQTRLRTRLLPGLIQVFRHNLHQPLPQRIYEVGDVTWLDEEAETGASEHRWMAFGIISPKTGFTDARACVDAVAAEFGVAPRWEPVAEAPFLEGRCARIVLPDGIPVGVVGEVSPEILELHGIGNPMILAELSIEGLAGLPPRRVFSLAD